MTSVRACSPKFLASMVRTLAADFPLDVLTRLEGIGYARRPAADGRVELTTVNFQRDAGYAFLAESGEVERVTLRLTEYKDVADVEAEAALSNIATEYVATLEGDLGAADEQAAGLEASWPVEGARVEVALAEGTINVAIARSTATECRPAIVRTPEELAWRRLERNVMALILTLEDEQIIEGAVRGCGPAWADKPFQIATISGRWLIAAHPQAYDEPPCALTEEQETKLVELGFSRPGTSAGIDMLNPYIRLESTIGSALHAAQALLAAARSLFGAESAADLTFATHPGNSKRADAWARAMTSASRFA